MTDTSANNKRIAKNTLFLYFRQILVMAVSLYTVRVVLEALGEEKDLRSSLLMELRRGTLVLSVLSQMGEPKYGYSLVQSLVEKGIDIDPNTLYPLLRRLEKQGLLESQWETGGSKPRKYYHRTDYGTQIYEDLKVQWEELSESMGKLLKEGEA